MKSESTRRNYLKTLGIAGTVSAGVSFAGCSSNSNSETDSGHDHNEATHTDSNGNGPTKTNTVDMTDDLGFEPDDIQVSVGTTVTWKNVGTIGHTVTAYEDKIPDDAAYFASGGFESEQAANDGYPDEGNIPEGGTYEYTFQTKGTYEYYCIPHEMNGMVGTVEVI